MYERIIEKAKKLGINPSSGNSLERLEEIALQLGINDFDPNGDISVLEDALDYELENNVEEYLVDEVEALDEEGALEEGSSYQSERKNQFGEKEYNAAKDDDGLYDKNYYKNRGKDLDDKVKQAEEEKNKKYKNNSANNNDSLKQNGTNKLRKNKFDNLKDNANLLKAKNERFQNKLSSAKSKVYQMMHPAESAKQKIKSKAKQTTKKAVSNTAKKVGKTAINGIKSIISMIPGGGAVLALIAIIIVIYLLIIMMFFFFSGEVNNESYNAECDTAVMSINTTGLTKEAFVRSLENYFANKSGEHVQVFLSNAANIYEKSVQNSINPELVVVRAVAEGFSPGISKNNYWGLGCSNTNPGACIPYSSFDEGLMAFINNVSQYESVEKMMKRYAYIGKYWYASDVKGAAGVGGCYYYPHIKEYMSAQRSNEVSKICTSTNVCKPSETSTCVRTTSEDQQAYSEWQVYKNMKAIRNTIFGAELKECKSFGGKFNYSGKYPTSPKDSLYSNLQLLHDKSLNAIMAEKGTDESEFESFIKSEVERAGVGTRNGVVAAAMSLIGGLAEMGVKINYQWGGKWATLGIRNNWGSLGSTNCNDYQNRGYKIEKCLNNYKWNGLDCSGFVTWAIKNGMQDNSISQSEATNGVEIDLNPNEAVCKPGDALKGPGHVVLVVGIDEAKKSYIIAEATGSNVSINSGGVKLTYYSFGKKDWHCESHTELYGEE